MFNHIWISKHIRPEGSHYVEFFYICKKCGRVEKDPQKFVGDTCRETWEDEPTPEIDNTQVLNFDRSVKNTIKISHFTWCDYYTYGGHCDCGLES